MTDYPAHLVRDHRLPDGRMVTIRPIRPDDADRMRDFILGMSPESRYLRFQKWVAMPSDKFLRFLIEVDHGRNLALVCVSAGEGGEQVIGEARYATNPDGRSCEFSIAIADSWQRTGIAGLLMDALIRAARERGLVTMDGIVLSTNAAMLRFVRALGFETSATPEDRTITRVVKRLRD